VSQHSHAEILSVFAGIVTEHVAALRDALIKLGEPTASGEDLHQFRVTLRRLRSAWVTFAPVLPRAFIAEWKPRLRTLAGSTGPVREWDVMLTDWLPAARAALTEDDEAGRAWLAAAFDRAKQARHLAWQTLRVELASPGVMNTLTELEGAVAAFRLPAQPPRLARFAHSRATALRKKLLRRGRHPKRATAARLHRARIAAKQWRYLYDAFYPALGVRAAKRYRKHLRKLQEALGEIHDASVSLERVALLVNEAPPASVVNAFHMRARAARTCAAEGLRWMRGHAAV